MGCASSKVLGNDPANQEPKGIVMPASQSSWSDNFHVVALTSSTYGILKVDQAPEEEEGTKDTARTGESVKEVLSKLSSIENGHEAAPQSWLEVSSMLQNLKPGLEKAPVNGNGTKFGQANLRKVPDAVDVSEIMQGLDDDPGPGLPIKPKLRSVTPASAPRPPPVKKSSKPFDKSMPIRTLEELEVQLKEKEKEREKELEKKSIAGIMASDTDDTNRESTLFDADLLGSYQKALTNLSEDDWKALESIGQAKSEEEEAHSPTSDHSTPDIKCNGQAPLLNGHVPVHIENDQWINTQDQVNSPQSAVQKDTQSPKIGQRSNAQASYSPDPQERRTQQFLKSATGQAHDASKFTNMLSHEPTEDSKTSGTMMIQQVSHAVPSKSHPLDKFEKICPPGGENSVVIYTTSLRGIRKTYDDCNNLRAIVESFGVPIDERDVSMHLEYRNELRTLMERLVTVPRLFIKGRYIGGIEELLKLHEAQKLAVLFDGLPSDMSSRKGCDGCGGARFIPCFECSGSCKAVNAEEQVIRCPDCNENGLVQCPICS